MMTDDVPNLESVPVTDATATDDDLATLADATGKISLKGKEKEHVHDENCQHDHAREPAEPQGRNDYDLLAIRGTKDNTTDPLVKVGKMLLVLTGLKQSEPDHPRWL